MNRTLGFALLLIIVGTILGGVHYYFWLRLVRDTSLSGNARQAGTVAVWALAFLVVATMLSGRLVPSLGRILAWPGFVWMGSMFILFFLLLLLDGIRLSMVLIAKLVGADGMFDASRRVFTARLIAGTAVAGAAGLVTAAVRSTRGRLTIKRVEVQLDKLAPALDGTRIVQLCDMHIGGLLGKSFVEEVVQMTNELKPDVVAIVGDLVDGTVEQLRPALASLADIKARYGAFFVTGNHEYYSASGARAWMDEMERMGLRTLRNQHVTVGTGEAGLDIAGVHDHSAGRFPSEGGGQDVAAALAGRDPQRPVVLLAHQPKAIYQSAEHGVDLQISGHTHGGQIWPWGVLVRLQQPFIRGLHRIGHTQLYVSCGTGFWGPPMRLAAPAEITEITLRART